MSGGAFDYENYKIAGIADDIEAIIEKNGRAYTREERKYNMGEAWYKEYPEEAFHPEYPPEVIEKLKEAVTALRIAGVYAQRVDYLLSGDDGEENFLKRLEKELNQFKNK